MSDTAASQSSDEPEGVLPADSLVYVLMGPSGAGKSTLAHALIGDKARKFNFELNSAWRTREKRPGEGDENHHCSIEEFEAADKAGKFLFTMDGYNEKFGTVVPRKLPANSFWLYIYLPENALKFKEFYPNARLIEILPRETINLEEVLLTRDPGMDEADLRQRIASAGAEMVHGMDIADIVYINDKPLQEAGEDFYWLIADDIQQHTQNSG